MSPTFLNLERDSLDSLRKKIDMEWNQKQKSSRSNSRLYIFGALSSISIAIARIITCLCKNQEPESNLSDVSVPKIKEEIRNEEINDGDVPMKD
jgi:hypothetical protein